jgi:hypothetical protein
MALRLARRQIVCSEYNQIKAYGGSAAGKVLAELPARVVFNALIHAFTARVMLPVEPLLPSAGSDQRTMRPTIVSASSQHLTLT